MFNCKNLYRKNPETVVVSGFSAPISKSVRIVGTRGDNGLDSKKVVVTKSVTTTRSGCGGRTRTYDLRVMRANFPEKYRIFSF